MSYPECKAHPGRVAELVCLSNECSKRLTLQCTICINATCKRHNWKLMQEAIEQIFELCQNEQARDEKRKRQGTQVETESTSTKEQVERLLADFNKKLKTREEEIMANATLRAQGLNSKGNNPEQLYVTVKGKVNDFRKSSDRSLASLDNILNTIKPLLGDDQDTGMLVFTSEPSSKGGILAPQVRDFQNYLNSFLQGSRLLRSNSLKSQNSSPGGVSEKEMQQLKTHYESQISNLIQQVKSIPILKSRIEAINMKLQAKDEKLKKYQQLGNLQVPNPSNPMKSSQVINQKVKESQVKAKRIQKLLEIREKLKSMMYNYTFKSPSEQVEVRKLLKSQDAHSIDVSNVYSDQANYLNTAMLVVADELSYLEYNEREENDPYVELQIITKKTQYRSKIYDYDDYNRLHPQTFGTRTYFPSRNY